MRVPFVTKVIGFHFDAQGHRRQGRVRVKSPSHRTRVAVRCHNGDGGKDSEQAESEKFTSEDETRDGTKGSRASADAKKKYREQLEQQGIDKSTAKTILEIWKEKGTENPDQLRRLFVKGSLAPLASGALQLLFDAGATYGSYYAGNLLRSLEPFPLQPVVVFVSIGLTFYFFAATLLDVTTFTAFSIAAFQLGANTEAFLDAVKELAGEGDISVVGKAKTAVNTVKVVQALNALADVLMERAGENADTASTLQNLSAYFIVSKAEKEQSFDPAKYGLSAEETNRIALSFASLDLNDDGVLEMSELRQLCDKLGGNLSDDELEEAIRLLDTNRNQLIDFVEFVDFWVNKVNVPSEEVQA